MFPLAMIRPYIYLVLVLALLGVVGAAYLKGREHGRDEIQLQQFRDAELVATTRAAAARGAAEEIAKIQVNHQTIRREVEREIVQKPVYRDCGADERVMRLVNDALAGRAPAVSDGSSDVPRGAPADG